MNAMPRERRWLWRWIVSVSILTLVPYIVAVAFAPRGAVFLGSLLNTDDTSQFLAAMRQGAEGNWIYRNQFTSEDTRPLVMYPLYMLWGKATGWMGNPVLAYHILRLGGAVSLLMVIQRLARTLLGDGVRDLPWRTAFLLAAFSSGLSWLTAFLPREIGTRYMADLSLIEISTFQSYFVVPHFAWGLALELLTFSCFLRAVDEWTQKRRSWRWVLGGGLACLGVGLTYPFALVMIYAVLAVFVLLALATGREWARPALWNALAIAILPAVLAIYYVVLFTFDPLWHATHVVGNTTGSPPVLTTILGYGLVLPLAVGGAIWSLRGKRWQERGLSFLLIWAIVNGLLPYVPVPFQGRFALGWHVALSVLAALGLDWLVRRIPPRRARRVRNVVVILTVPSTLLILLAGPYMAITARTFPFYLPRSELRAVDWLAERVREDDVVLASYAMGNVIPARAPCRVFVGHQFETYRLEDKLAMVDTFFATDTADADRRALLYDHSVTFVYHGSIERGKGGYEPSQAPYLERVYEDDGVAVYAVRLDELLPRAGSQGR